MFDQARAQDSVQGGGQESLQYAKMCEIFSVPPWRFFKHYFNRIKTNENFKAEIIKNYKTLKNA